MDPLRIAVVGCGAIAELQHLPALAASRQARAVALVDRELARAQALARRWRVPRAAADVAEVADDIDAAILALPNHLHAPVAIDLLRRGIHVLVEKPMAPTVADCDAMIAAAAGSGAVLAVGLEFRFFDSTDLVRELLGAGLVGPLAGFELRQGVIPRWPFASDFVLRKETAGGGVLADFGVHVLDLLLCWLGDWRAVECADDARGGLEADAELALTMASGVGGTVEVSRTRNLRNTCRFAGERGVLEVGVWDPDPEVVLRLPAGDTVLAGRARRGGRALTFRDAFCRQLDDFVGAVRDGREPRVPGREGRRTIALVEACYARRRPLALPWDAPSELGAWQEPA
ncbi:MAG TPA: Gfo/Idh/MocA family oxidoreductase [Thermoanaerobaculia bacterium]|jgi:predicted dehydrogenase|nr:Gfo/Idh/MocA family oxidoreductase [Thermoanaerobaculia bacterium]